MRHSLKRTGLGLVLLWSSVLAVPAAARLQARQARPQTRTVYVSVLEKDSGKSVPGLTAADFKVRDGKNREITAVAVPTARMTLTVLVDEALSPDTATRQAIMNFAQRMVRSADVSIVAAGNKNTSVVDHTSDVQKILAGLNSVALLQPPRLGNHVVEGIYEIAKQFQRSRPDRPVIVSIAYELRLASAEHPDRVLNDLRLSRAVLEAVAVEFQAAAATGDLAADSAKVVGDGSKQSGGRRIGVTSVRAIPLALAEVADDLDAQYAITYVVPAGEKPQEWISVSTSRKNVALRAPTRVNQN